MGVALPSFPRASRCAAIDLLTLDIHVWNTISNVHILWVYRERDDSMD